MLSFVLSRRDFKESDQMITLFTAERGKIEVIAKGIKKVIAKNSAFLEPFFLIEAEIVEGKELWHLTKTVPIEIFKNIRENLDKSLLAGYVCKILDIVLPLHLKEKKIFDLFFGFLHYLESAKEVNRVLGISFLWKVLSLQGYLPILKNCAICGEKKETKYFSAMQGGCICVDCKNKIIDIDKLLLISKEDKENLKTLITGVWSEIKLNQKDLEKQQKILSIFCAYHSEKKIPLPGALLK